MTIRAARPDDAPAVAMLHANSWRSAYRGILRDEFLDGALDENRRIVLRRATDQSDHQRPLPIHSKKFPSGVPLLYAPVIQRISNTAIAIHPARRRNSHEGKSGPLERTQNIAATHPTAPKNIPTLMCLMQSALQDSGSRSSAILRPSISQGGSGPDPRSNPVVPLRRREEREGGSHTFDLTARRRAEYDPRDPTMP